MHPSCDPACLSLVLVEAPLALGIAAAAELPLGCRPCAPPILLVLGCLPPLPQLTCIVLATRHILSSTAAKAAAKAVAAAASAAAACGSMVYLPSAQLDGEWRSQSESGVLDC